LDRHSLAEIWGNMKRSEERSYYIDVTEIDAVYVDMLPRPATLADARYRAPFSQDYDQ